MNEKVLNLAKKLKALADRGVGGEANNANEKLQQLCRKYNISISEIEEDAVSIHCFFLGDTFFELKFFKQIVYSVNPIGRRIFQYKYKMKRAPGKIRMGIECTSSEFVEIMAKFEFFFSDFQKQSDLFYRAYIQKNRIYKKNTGEHTETKKELTPEEKGELFKIVQMMLGIDNKVFHKQLS